MCRCVMTAYLSFFGFPFRFDLLFYFFNYNNISRTYRSSKQSPVSPTIIPSVIIFIVACPAAPGPIIALSQKSKFQARAHTQRTIFLCSPSEIGGECFSFSTNPTQAPHKVSDKHRRTSTQDIQCGQSAKAQIKLRLLMGTFQIIII